jgi:HD-like signal output (HDOD) protein
LPDLVSILRLTRRSKRLKLPVAMSKRSPDEFRLAVQKVQRLYSTPQVLAKALKLLRDPDVDLADVSGLVRLDAALSADLLHLSNSALYSRGGDCTDLHLAVQRLGLREVLRAIGLSLTKNVFGKGLVNYGISASQYWGLSVLAGLVMEALARRANLDAAEAYLVGILHAIGRVLINEALQELGVRERWDGVTPLEEFELEHVGFTNAEAGALLLIRWDFPETMRQPIANQFGETTATSSGAFTGLLRLTLLLVKPTGTLIDKETLPDTFSRQVLIWAGFREWDELQELLAKVEDSFARVQTTMEPGR